MHGNNKPFTELVCVCVRACVRLHFTTVAAKCHHFRLVAPTTRGTVYEKKVARLRVLKAQAAKLSLLT